jgi:hypothetical protein
MQLPDLELLYAKIDKISKKFKEEEEAMKKLPFSSRIIGEECELGYHLAEKRLKFYNAKTDTFRPVLECKIEDRIKAYRMLPELHKQIDKDLREFLEKLGDM